MRIVRGVLLAAMLSGTGWLVLKEQSAGRLRQIDEAFLDFLVANSRERFTDPELHGEHGVIKVVLDEADAADYEGWPPRPLDWQMLLDGLDDYEPDVLVITTPLAWGRPAPDFVPAVAAALLPFPSVVLAAEASRSESTQDPPGSAFLGDLDAAIPRFPHITGPLQSAPLLSSVVVPPDLPLRRSGESGLFVPMDSEGSSAGPWAAFASGDELLPSLWTQALARATRTPYSRSRIRVGSGAGLHLDEGLYVPLETDGAVATGSESEVPEVNALDLITASIAGELAPEAERHLEEGELIVIGTRAGADTPSQVDRQAAALASALAAPRIHVLTATGQWTVWGLAAIAASWLVFGVPRKTVPRWGLIFIFLAFSAGFVAFQTSLWWCPPSMPLALLVAGTLCGIVAGRSPTETHPAPEASEVPD
jgi:hypothetical protein